MSTAISTNGKARIHYVAYFACYGGFIVAFLCILYALFFPDKARVTASFALIAIAVGIVSAMSLLVRLQLLLRILTQDAPIGNGDFAKLTKFEPGLAEKAKSLHEIRINDSIRETQKRQAELYAMQSQINPHFLYNTLDSIRGKMMNERLFDMCSIIEALSRLFRYSISQETVYNTIEQELSNIDDYFTIIKYRFGDRFSLSKIVEDKRDEIYNYEIPKLTLQPIIENAVQHGLEKKRGKGSITVRIRQAGDELYIMVEDDGVGMDALIVQELNEGFQKGDTHGSREGAGIALVNVDKRIKTLFGNNYGVYVNSVPNFGTQVSIRMRTRTRLGFS